MKLSTIKPEWILWGVGAGVALIALNALMGGRILTGAAGSIGRAPVDIFMGGAEGLLGLPDTRTPQSVSECQKALAAGDDWRASFVCPAVPAVKGWFDGEWF